MVKTIVEEKTSGKPLQSEITKTINRNIQELEFERRKSLKLYPSRTESIAKLMSVQ